MEMTHKQRILAAARKQTVDKLPFGARIEIWYNYHLANDTLPEKYKGLSIPDILRDLGAGCQVVLAGKIGPATVFWGEEVRNMEVVVTEEPPFITTEYRTPVGVVSTKEAWNSSESSLNAYTVERLFKDEKDYPAIEYLFENTTVIPDLSEYQELADNIGEDGIIFCGLRASPMQYIMRDIMGYERFFYELYDHPQKVDQLYEVYKELCNRELDIVADSPAELPLICSNWTDDVHTPVFKKYFTPWLQEATKVLHAHGKLAKVHIDGEMRRLIPFVVETGIDVAEAWTPAPMTSVTTAELRKAWGDRVTIWGGVPATLFEPEYTDEEFDAYIINLFKEIAPGNNFIVGMGDNLPIDGKIERVQRIVELIDKYGSLPIEI